MPKSSNCVSGPCLSVFVLNLLFDQKRRKVATGFSIYRTASDDGVQRRSLAAVVINYARQMTFTESWGVIDDAAVT